MDYLITETFPGDRDFNLFVKTEPGLENSTENPLQAEGYVGVNIRERTVQEDLGRTE